MSSYLNIYLVPKRKGNREEKKHLLLSFYSRNSDIYGIFYENISPIFSGNGDTYTTLTKVDVQGILDDLDESIKSTKEMLELYDKYAKDNPDYIQEIMNTREILRDYQSTYNMIEVLKDILEDIENGYNDFEEMCCNID